MAEQRRVTGLLWLVKWFVIITLLVLVIDIICVFVLWSPNGVEQLQATLQREAALLNLSPEHLGFLADMTHRFYNAVFVSSGIDGAMGNAYLTTPSEKTKNMHEFYGTFRPLIETAMIGLQLYALRIGVLILSLPFLVIITAAAVMDGLLGWFLRRTSGDRESGFIYHRAKRCLGWSYVLFWVLYLLPPTPIDPNYLIPPFLVVAGVTTRLQVAYFKKFL